MSISKNILDLIPQRPPIVMVSEVVEVAADSVTTNLKIEANNIFVENEELCEPGLIENMAQSAAAMEGCNATDGNIKLGFIGAVKKLNINRLPKAGTTITTKIKVETQALGVNIVSGKVFDNNELIADCTLNIFLQE